MPLRQFHIVFICSALSVCLFLGWFAASQYFHSAAHAAMGHAHETVAYGPLFAVAVAGSVVIGSYLVWFLRKKPIERPAAV